MFFHQEKDSIHLIWFSVSPTLYWKFFALSALSNVTIDGNLMSKQLCLLNVLNAVMKSVPMPKHAHTAVAKLKNTLNKRRCWRTSALCPQKTYWSIRYQHYVWFLRHCDIIYRNCVRLQCLRKIKFRNRSLGICDDYHLPHLWWIMLLTLVR